MAKQVSCISFFEFRGSNKWWIFGQMGKPHNGISDSVGLRFSKLMGSGGGDGFSAWPDFSTYALLTVWDSETNADHFFSSDSFFHSLEEHSSGCTTIYMHNHQAHGTWSGVAPFEDFQEYEHGPIAAITRAIINPYQLVDFWRHVPSTANAVSGQSGLLYAKGIGEYPLFMQATISFWNSKEALKNYAYSSRMHREVVQKTRKRNWYKEELFGNFIPFRKVDCGRSKIRFNMSFSDF